MRITTVGSGWSVDVLGTNGDECGKLYVGYKRTFSADGNSNAVLFVCASEDGLLDVLAYRVQQRDLPPGEWAVFEISYVPVDGLTYKRLFHANGERIISGSGLFKPNHFLSEVLKDEIADLSG
jgi:hypothetical protein